jgi:hypothetical protein
LWVCGCEGCGGDGDFVNDVGVNGMVDSVESKHGVNIGRDQYLKRLVLAYSLYSSECCIG